MLAYLIFAVVVMAFFSALTWLMSLGGSPAESSSDKLVALREYEFPEHVRQVHARRYPQRSFEEQRMAFDALKDFFLLMYLERRAGRSGSLGMPSVLADEAWQSFVLSTQAYAAFCQAFFGETVHRLPGLAGPVGPLSADAQFTLEVERTWRAAQRHGSLSRMAELPNNASARTAAPVPILFAADELAGVSEGWQWSAASLEALNTSSTRKKSAEVSGDSGGSACLAVGSPGLGSSSSGSLSGAGGSCSSGDSGGCGGDGGGGGD